MTKEQAVFVCSHVFDQMRPVLLVCHDGGDWQFLCGGEHAEGEIPHVVGLNHILDLDPSLQELMNIPIDSEAERQAPDLPWILTGMKSVD